MTHSQHPFSARAPQGRRLKSGLLATGLALGLAQVATQAAAQPAGLEEVVVTAQRRTENVQRAPVAIDVLSASRVENANLVTAQDLTRLVPALQVTPVVGPMTSFFLRGVGNQSANQFTDAAVAFNYAGVYIGRPASTSGVYYDLERVEVLKGPQGILYGRNATAGAINVIPRAPRLGEFSGDLSVEGGNYNALRSSGAANIPLGDRAAARVAFHTGRADPFFDSGASEEDGTAARAQVRVEPNDDLAFTVGADYYHQGGTTQGFSFLPPPDGNYRRGVGDQRNCSFIQPSFAAAARVPLAQALCLPGQDYMNSDYWGTQAQIDWSGPLGKLTVLPAHRFSGIRYRSLEFSGGGYVVQDDDINQDSLEVRLASADDSARFRYVAGAFYFKEQIDGSFTSYTGQSYSGQTTDLSTTSWAVFGQGTVGLTDTFRLSGGVRFTRDDKTAKGFLNQLAVVTFAPVPNGAIVLNDAKKWDSVTWRANAEWEVSPTSLLYATVETGFKAGGFYFAPAPIPASFDPEKLTAYTFGSKNRFLDNRLLLNLEIFDYQYTGQQISYAAIIGGLSLFPTQNVGEARYRGAEVTSQFLVTPNTIVGAQIQYNDAEYDKFQYVTIGAVQGVNNACKVTPAAAPTVTVDCSGRRPNNAPEWVVNLSGQQTFPLSNGASLVASLDSRYQTEVFTDLTYLPATVQPAYWRHDVTLAYKSAGERWSLTGFVNNLTDEVVFNAARQGRFTGLFIGALLPPRTYGLRLSVKLGGD